MRGLMLGPARGGSRFAYIGLRVACLAMQRLSRALYMIECQLLSRLDDHQRFEISSERSSIPSRLNDFADG